MEQFISTLLSKSERNVKQNKAMQQERQRNSQLITMAQEGHSPVLILNFVSRHQFSHRLQVIVLPIQKV